jgi:hypothetical protein
MSKYHPIVQVTFQDGNLLNTFQASSMLPHFAYMSTKLLPTKTSDLQLLWMISLHEHACPL